MLPRILAVVFSGFGFCVRVNPVEGNGVDLWVYEDSELVLAIEVLNWSIRSRLSNKRKGKIIDNLSRYKCNRVLVYSVPNSNVDEEFAKKSVDTLCIGFQLQPRKFYKFFEERRQVIRRRPISLEAVQAIKRIIKNYLVEKGLL